MKNFKTILVALFCLSLVYCSDDNDIKDTEKPVINLDNGFPLNCAVIKKGMPFTFKATFTDNVALGSYSIDIHNNFDHHTHSTEDDSCDLEVKKDALKPFGYIKTFPIDGNPKTYDATQTISIKNDYDSGDYHFMIKVTDKEGWSTLKGLSIKVID